MIFNEIAEKISIFPTGKIIVVSLRSIDESFCA